MSAPVKLLDANILLYAYDGDSEHHTVCRRWLEAVFNSEEIVALAALAMEHGATLCSTDKDCRRFRDLKLIDPTDLG